MQSAGSTNLLYKSNASFLCVLGSARPQLLQVVKIWGRINHAFYFFLRLSHVRSYRTQEFCGIALCSFRAKMATCAHLASPPNQSHAPKLKHLNPYNHQSKPKESADFENWESTFVRAFFSHSVAFQTSHRRTSALDVSWRLPSCQSTHMSKNQNS